MKLSFSASGDTAAVNSQLHNQIKTARAQHPTLSATIASLRDDLGRLADQDGTVTLAVTIEVTADVQAAPLHWEPLVSIPARVAIPDDMRTHRMDSASS